MSWSRYQRIPYPEYVHKVHYTPSPNKTLCSTWKTCGKKKPQMTADRSKVTCKICLKKLGITVNIGEHFEEDLFTI